MPKSIFLLCKWPKVGNNNYFTLTGIDLSSSDFTVNHNKIHLYSITLQSCEDILRPIVYVIQNARLFCLLHICLFHCTYHLLLTVKTVQTF